MKQAVILALAVAGDSAPAAAHVVLSPRGAPAASYYSGAFHVGHGCAGSATTALRVEIPAAIVNAKPQPKAGWTLEIEREPLAAPFKGEGGETITTRAKAFTWRGRLPEEQFDEFGVTAKLPAWAGRAGVSHGADLRTGREPLGRSAGGRRPAASGSPGAHPHRHSEGHRRHVRDGHVTPLIPIAKGFVPCRISSLG